MTKQQTGLRRDFQIFAKPAGARCNLRCRYCYYLDSGLHTGACPTSEMSPALLERYISQHIAASGGETISFSWHGGEPTLLGIDYFRRIVQLQKQHCPPGRRIANGIQTNGTLIDDSWAGFLAEHGFSVGLSLDGPAQLHDLYRGGSHAAALEGYQRLVRHGVPVDVLCVVHDLNVMYPLQVYRFFTSIGVRHLSFLPLVELLPDSLSSLSPMVSDRSVPPEAFGAFLCTIFDTWLAEDIGSIKVQIFEEALRSAFGQEHSLCLFRPECGEVLVLEHDGSLYACDHFVSPGHCLGRITEHSLAELLDSPRLREFAARKGALAAVCRSCDVLELCRGECPKNRFVPVAGSTENSNYLCAGYRLFFRHCRPFAETVCRQWRRQHSSAD